MLFLTIYHFPGLAEAVSHESHTNSWLGNHLVCVVPSIFLNLYLLPHEHKQTKTNHANYVGQLVQCKDDAMLPLKNNTVESDSLILSA